MWLTHRSSERAAAPCHFKPALNSAQPFANQPFLV
jgi:hypothetical protein